MYVSERLVSKTRIFGMLKPRFSCGNQLKIDNAFIALSPQFQGSLGADSEQCFVSYINISNIRTSLVEPL